MSQSDEENNELNQEKLSTQSAYNSLASDLKDQDQLFTDQSVIDNINQYESEKLQGDLVVDKLVEVKFKADRSSFYYNINSLPYCLNSMIIVEATRGYDIGIVASIGQFACMKMQARKIPLLDIRNVIRIATQEDLTKFTDNKIKEEEAFKVASSKIIKHDLSMKLVDVEYQLDKSRITFYYTADHRIDFRELVKDLARVYHTRIEMRQIGVRDETKRVGGIGVCGRQLCCRTWLKDFERITTQCVIVQGLVFNPIKLSGQCSRLKCCLAYELENYSENYKNLSNLNANKSPKIKAKLGEIDFGKNTIQVKFEDGTSEEVPLEELNSRKFE